MPLPEPLERIQGLSGQWDGPAAVGALQGPTVRLSALLSDELGPNVEEASRGVQVAPLEPQGFGDAEARGDEEGPESMEDGIGPPGLRTRGVLGGTLGVRQERLDLIRGPGTDGRSHSLLDLGPALAAEGVGRQLVLFDGPIHRGLEDDPAHLDGARGQRPRAICARIGPIHGQ